MRIAKGIKGIKAIIAEDNQGWHLIAEEKHYGFYDLRLSEILATENMHGVMITGVTGNVIWLGPENA